MNCKRGKNGQQTKLAVIAKAASVHTWDGYWISFEDSGKLPRFSFTWQMFYGVRWVTAGIRSLTENG